MTRVVDAIYGPRSVLNRLIRGIYVLGRVTPRPVRLYSIRPSLANLGSTTYRNVRNKVVSHLCGYLLFSSIYRLLYYFF